MSAPRMIRESGLSDEELDKLKDEIHNNQRVHAGWCGNVNTCAKYGEYLTGKCRCCGFGILKKGSYADTEEGGDQMNKLQMLMSMCKRSVHITANNHRNDYESAEEFFLRTESNGCSYDIEPVIKRVMIEKDTIIELIFYPDTPIGFHSIYHYDLEMALDEALECLCENKQEPYATI